MTVTYEPPRSTVVTAVSLAEIVSHQQGPDLQSHQARGGRALQGFRHGLAVVLLQPGLHAGCVYIRVQRRLPGTLAWRL